MQAIDDLTSEYIIPSGDGIYIIELSTRIKSIKYYLTGMNIIWNGHISVSILTYTLKDKLSAYCFSQYYLTSPLKYQGRKNINQANSALNKDFFDFDLNDYEDTWFYIRSTFNWDNEIYYLKYEENSVEPKPVIHETANFGQINFIIHLNIYSTNMKYIFL